MRVPIRITRKVSAPRGAKSGLSAKAREILARTKAAIASRRAFAADTSKEPSSEPPRMKGGRSLLPQVANVQE